MSKTAMVALYARVSSEQQNKRGTIESQIAALKERISAADGIIDKTDFEPKMQQLKKRLEQIDQQILESRQQGAVQSELFLVINRLEEFAGAVTEKLDTIDLETKRRIVLGLVKPKSTRMKLLWCSGSIHSRGRSPAKIRMIQTPE
jgi:DNA invertase Pin-like site-specific DNA recombinase